jgi:aspartyl-tRNA(Asn)/glutamyl-tRNA(Gln) amidotransferase subunit A
MRVADSDAFAPAFELVKRVRQREVTPVELVERSLERIQSLDPKINAFTALCGDAALEAAKSLGERIARGEDPGLLAGIPIGVKDLEDVAGMVTSHGSVPLRDNRATSDSVQVARLKAAGAIVVGKTNTPEFGCTAFTKNRLFGTTRNPWNLERTPGGSSGGSSAAVASGMVPLATGGDGGGSVRIPACYTGLFGIKPSFGRIPRGPLQVLPWIDTVSLGPLARSVRDAALYLDAVAGVHPCDPTSLPDPTVKYSEVLGDLPRGLKIAFSPTLGFATVAPDVAREAERARQAFGDLGHRVTVDECPLPDLGAEWGLLSAAEEYGLLADLFDRHRDDWGRGFAKGLEMARDLVTPKFIGMAQRRRSELNDAVASIFERYDLLLTPTLPTEAFAAGGPLPDSVGGVKLKSPMHAVAFTFPFNLTGHPAATVRAGFSDAGLPVGLQIVAPRQRDDLVLQAAYAYEQARPWNDRWPELR